ncbi:MAG: phosphoglucosamine mutase [Oscillospiraceae bacterium]|jgi:phosphoglucosamine mutase|nr:phosphoglucosamine mutase [Oscillospiraceae bacterium]
MGRLFGTDGVRGVAITELTPELAMNIGKAVAFVISEKQRNPKICIGKDPRVSSDILECALTAGMCSVGADVISLGTVPTPAVAALTVEKGYSAGIMISASHNSMEFNGIKIFSGLGYKLSDEMEDEIEHFVNNSEKIPLAAGGEVGRYSVMTDAANEYVNRIVRICMEENGTEETDYLNFKTHAENAQSRKLRIAVDCANGSAGVTAKKLFESLGAQCEIFNAETDGININSRCGSTDMTSLQETVKSGDFDAGIAFDGDADRFLAVNENGEIVDGDKIMAVCAKAYNDKGILKDSAVVVTVMTNIGFTYFAEENGIKVITANVGDRYVLEKMLENGYNLGGEQSGHIIFLDDATTGDGQLSAARFLRILATSGTKVSELTGIMEHFPQVLVNVKIRPETKSAWKNDAGLKDIIEKYENELSDGRILVRESGTEPLIRVMLEGKNLKKIEEIANNVAGYIKEKFGSEDH